jgi:hypothetical protein
MNQHDDSVGKDGLAPNESPGPVSRAHASIDEQVRRVDAVTTWLATGLTPRQCSTKARDSFRVGRRHANRYVAWALKRLAKDNSDEPIESKRARVLAIAYGNVVKASKRKRVVVTKESVEEFDDPDIGGSNGALALIAKLEGLG